MARRVQRTFIRRPGNGWSKQRLYEDQTSPNEKRDVLAFAKLGGGGSPVCDPKHPGSDLPPA